ncbi:MAG: carbohydrate ABC transporter permease [Beutenbergiaceae bacterium]
MNAPEGQKGGQSPGAVTSRYYWWFVAPAGVAVLALFVAPVIYVIWLAMRNYNLLIGTDRFVGVDNLVRAITSDHEFVGSIGRTLIYVVLVVGTDFVVGMIQALLVYELAPRLRKVVRTIFLLPVLLIPAAGAVFWRMVMYGPPNEQLLRIFGLDGVVAPPLSLPTTAFLAIIVTVIWAWSPWVFLLLSGGLDGLDRSILEASEVDGAGYFRRLFSIILPMMKPVIFVALSFKAVDSFLSFPFVWIMTQGGPSGSTHLVSTYIYERAFQFLDYGYGSAMALILLVVSAGLSIAAASYWARTQKEA